MTAEIRVLDSEDDLTAAANVFRTAMVGLPPLPNLKPGQIAELLEPGRTVAAFVGAQLVGTAAAFYGVLRNTSLRVTVRRFRERMMSTSCG